MKKAVKTVFVGLSGGVDSSVSAALLKASLPAGRQGYRVVGVFIRTWHPDFIECNEYPPSTFNSDIPSFLS